MDSCKGGIGVKPAPGLHKSARGLQGSALGVTTLELLRMQCGQLWIPAWRQFGGFDQCRLQPGIALLEDAGRNNPQTLPRGRQRLPERSLIFPDEFSPGLAVVFRDHPLRC